MKVVTDDERHFAECCPYCGRMPDHHMLDCGNIQYRLAYTEPEVPWWKFRERGIKRVYASPEQPLSD